MKKQIKNSQLEKFANQALTKKQKSKVKGGTDGTPNETAETSIVTGDIILV